MIRTIALTGATGFAGGHAVAELLRRGHKLRALVRNPSAATLPAEVDIVAGDLDQGDALDRLAEGADAVVHLAGAISAVRRHDYFRVNAHGTVAVAEAAIRARVPRFVHISSLAARRGDLSAYGASKRAGEDAIAKLMDPLHAIIVRPPAVYGPGDRATLPLIKLLTQAIAVIPGSPANVFSLIHAGDLARIIADAAESQASGLHEVSDGKAGGYTWDDLLKIGSAERGGPIRAIFLPRAIPAVAAVAAEAMSHLTGKPGMLSRDKARELYHPDWVARSGSVKLAEPIGFARGFRETLEWYRRAGWLPRPAGADTSAAGANDGTPP